MKLNSHALKQRRTKRNEKPRLQKLSQSMTYWFHLRPEKKNQNPVTCLTLDSLSIINRAMLWSLISRGQILLLYDLIQSFTTATVIQSLPLNEINIQMVVHEVNQKWQLDVLVTSFCITLAVCPLHRSLIFPQTVYSQCPHLTTEFTRGVSATFKS